MLVFLCLKFECNVTRLFKVPGDNGHPVVAKHNRAISQLALWQVVALNSGRCAYCLIPEFLHIHTNTNSLQLLNGCI